MASDPKLNAQIEIQVEHAFRVLFSTLDQEHDVQTAYMSKDQRAGLKLLKGELTMWLTQYIAHNQKRTRELGDDFLAKGGYYAAMVYTPLGPAKRKPK